MTGMSSLARRLRTRWRSWGDGNEFSLDGQWELPAADIAWYRYLGQWWREIS